MRTVAKIEQLYRVKIVKRGMHPRISLHEPGARGSSDFVQPTSQLFFDGDHSNRESERIGRIDVAYNAWITPLKKGNMIRVQYLRSYDCVVCVKLLPMGLNMFQNIIKQWIILKHASKLHPRMFCRC